MSLPQLTQKKFNKKQPYFLLESSAGSNSRVEVASNQPIRNTPEAPSNSNTFKDRLAELSDEHLYKVNNIQVAVDQMMARNGNPETIARKEQTKNGAVQSLRETISRGGEAVRNVMHSTVQAFNQVKKGSIGQLLSAGFNWLGAQARNQVSKVNTFIENQATRVKENTTQIHQRIEDRAMNSGMAPEPTQISFEEVPQAANQVFEEQVTQEKIYPQATYIPNVYFNTQASQFSNPENSFSPSNRLNSLRNQVPETQSAEATNESAVPEVQQPENNDLTAQLEADYQTVSETQPEILEVAKSQTTPEPEPTEAAVTTEKSTEKTVEKTESEQISKFDELRSQVEALQRELEKLKNSNKAETIEEKPISSFKDVFSKYQETLAKLGTDLGSQENKDHLTNVLTAIGDDFSPHRNLEDQFGLEPITLEDKFRVYQQMIACCEFQLGSPLSEIQKLYQEHIKNNALDLKAGDFNQFITSANEGMPTFMMLSDINSYKSPSDMFKEENKFTNILLYKIQTDNLSPFDKWLMDKVAESAKTNNPKEFARIEKSAGGNSRNLVILLGNSDIFKSVINEEISATINK